MVPSNKRKPKKPVNKVNEPLADYFKSEKYLESFRKVEISTLEEQEQANRIFSASLTPVQRLELLQYLNNAVFADYINKLPDKFETNIYFDD